MVSIYIKSSYAFKRSLNKISELLLNVRMTEQLNLNNVRKTVPLLMSVTYGLRKNGLKFGRGFEGDRTIAEFKV